MNTRQLLACSLFAAVMTVGCGSSAPIDSPYDTCYSGDRCAAGLTCATTTLPVSSGYTGAFCTSGCTYDSDCVQVPSNYSAACVDNQCYLTCPSGNYSCPYGQDCFTFDSNLGSIDLCTP